MNEQEIEKITQSTNVISEWSVQLLRNLGFAEKWINYINLVFLLLILVIKVFIHSHGILAKYHCEISCPW